jgi:hypothetical protein
VRPFISAHRAGLFAEGPPRFRNPGLRDPGLLRLDAVASPSVVPTAASSKALEARFGHDPSSNAQAQGASHAHRIAIYATYPRLSVIIVTGFGNRDGLKEFAESLGFGSL